MKIFLAALGAVVVATTCVMTACNSDDNSSPGTTVIANVGDGGVCTETANCGENLQCAFSTTAACPADGGTASGTCVPFAACTVQTFCPCGGGAAFDECVYGNHVSTPVTGNLSCVVVDAGSGEIDAAIDGALATDSGSDPATDAATDAKGDAAQDAETDAPVVLDAGTDASDAALD